MIKHLFVFLSYNKSNFLTNFRKPPALRNSNNLFLLAAVGSLAPRTTSVLLETSSNCLGGLCSTFDIGTFWHFVLLQSFKHSQSCLLLTHRSDCSNLVAVIDVVSNKTVFTQITHDVHLSIPGIVSNELQRLVVVARPEKRNLTIRHHLAQHVERSI